MHDDVGICFAHKSRHALTAVSVKRPWTDCPLQPAIEHSVNVEKNKAQSGDMRTQMHQEAFPGEDISDRPEPETVVPALRRGALVAVPVVYTFFDDLSVLFWRLVGKKPKEPEPAPTPAPAAVAEVGK